MEHGNRKGIAWVYLGTFFTWLAMFLLLALKILGIGTYSWGFIFMPLLVFYGFLIISIIVVLCWLFAKGEL